MGRKVVIFGLFWVGFGGDPKMGQILGPDQRQFLVKGGKKGGKVISSEWRKPPFGLVLALFDVFAKESPLKFGVFGGRGF